VLTLAEGETPEAVALPAGPTCCCRSPSGWRAATSCSRAQPASAVGVWLDSHEGPEALADDLDRFAVIGVNFPKFTDGRSYSSARLLRERYGYAARSAPSATCCRTSSSTCALRHRRLRAARRQGHRAGAGRLTVFSETYQAAVDQPLPLFRRARHRPGAA
jgi:uncharacterized protein (DUF934 family)